MVCSQSSPAEDDASGDGFDTTTIVDWADKEGQGKPAKRVERDGVRISWKGFVWSLDGISERELLEQEAQRIAAGGSVDHRRYLGTYAIEITERKLARTSIFVDSTAIFALFRCGDRLSTSFLDLATSMGMSGADLDMVGVAQFILSRGLHEGRTLLKGISRLGPDDVIVVEKGTTRLEKKMSESPTDAGNGFDEAMTALSRALRGHKVAVDLTGGLDSRLLFAALGSKGADFEVGLSGNEKFREFAIAETVARAGGKSINRMIHKVGEFDAQSMDALLGATDAIVDVVRYHRCEQLARSREERGIEVSLAGDGGECVRDGWWQQDLPLYASRFVRMRRFVRFNVLSAGAYGSAVEIVGPGLREAMTGLEDRLCKHFERFRRPTNTATYDDIVYEDVAGGRYGVFATRSSQFVPMLFPYFDPPVKTYCRNLKARVRLFGIQQRRLIGAYAPAVAACPTNYGTTASPRVMAILMDVIPTFVERLKRYLTYRLRPATMKSGAEDRPDDPNLIPSMKKAAGEMDLQSWLHRSGMLLPTKSLADIPTGMLGGFITVGLLVRRLESAGARNSAN